VSTTYPNRPTANRSANRRKRGEPRAFDFRKQNKLSREHVRTMQIVQETFARGFSTMLSSQLRSVTQVAIRTVEQRSYDEYVRGLENPTFLTLLGLTPLAGAAIFQLPLNVAFCAIELMLGGHGNAEQPTRPFSDLELQLMRDIIERAMPELRYAFEPVVVTEPKIMGQESNPQFAQIAAPTDMVIVVEFDVKIESVSGLATLCVPFSSLQPHLEALSSTSLYAGQSAANAGESRARLVQHLTDTPVSVSAQFRQIEMSASDIVRLSVGDVVPLSHPVDEPLTLTVDNVAAFDARIGRRNRRFAVQVVGAVSPDRSPQRSTRFVLASESAR
jgi:flagellar motor switch protein FliM